MKASDEKGGNKGLVKAELEEIFGKPKPNVVSVAWKLSQYSAMNNWWKMTEIDESLLQEGIFLSRLDSYIWTEHTQDTTSTWYITIQNIQLNFQNKRWKMHDNQ